MFLGALVTQGFYYIVYDACGMCVSDNAFYNLSIKDM